MATDTHSSSSITVAKEATRLSEILVQQVTEASPLKKVTIPFPSEKGTEIRLSSLHSGTALTVKNQTMYTMKISNPSSTLASVPKLSTWVHAGPNNNNNNNPNQ